MAGRSNKKRTDARHERQQRAWQAFLKTNKDRIDPEIRLQLATARRFGFFALSSKAKQYIVENFG